MVKRTFYAKCKRKFFIENNEPVLFHQIQEFDNCTGCKYIEELNKIKKGQPIVLKGCVIGQLKPNNKAQYETSSYSDSSKLYIYAFEPEFIKLIFSLRSTMHGIIDIAILRNILDLRKEIAITFTDNSKGIAAKQQIIESYFKNTAGAAV